MKTVHIVMTLIEQGDNYVLQRRDTNPNIGAAGLVGCFGGKIESRETAAEAAARELQEETNLSADQKMLVRVGEVNVMSVFQGQPIKVNSQVFKFKAGPEVNIAAADGKKVVYAKGEASSHLSDMTPATRATFEKFILQDKN